MPLLYSNNSIISVSITIVINFAMYTYNYLVYHNTDEGRRRCRNMSVVKKLKVVVYVLKILTSLLLNRPITKSQDNGPEIKPSSTQTLMYFYLFFSTPRLKQLRNRTIR